MIGKNYIVNEWVSCACKCGQQLRKYDRWGRRKHYINYHFPRKDWSNTYCLDCSSFTTKYNKKGYPMWFKKDDGYVCRKCCFKYQYKRYVEKHPLKGRHKDMSGRYCKLCNSKKTYLAKNSRSGNFYRLWFKYKNNWICRNCKDRIKWGENREREVRENGIMVRTPVKERSCYQCKQKTYVTKKGYEYWHHIGLNRYICHRCYNIKKKKPYIINSL